MRTRKDEIINKIKESSLIPNWDINEACDFLITIENDLRIYINNDVIKLVHCKTSGEKILFFIRALDGYQDLINECIGNINNSLITKAYARMFGG